MQDDITQRLSAKAADLRESIDEAGMKPLNAEERIREEAEELLEVVEELLADRP